MKNIFSHTQKNVITFEQFSGFMDELAKSYLNFLYVDIFCTDEKALKETLTNYCREYSAKMLNHLNIVVKD